MDVINLDSPIEKIMEQALKKNGIAYDAQYALYERGSLNSWNHKYLLDFVVYGQNSKIVVECDGKDYHSTDEQRAYDTTRDIWTLRHGFDDVLRFTGSEITRNVQSCIEQIKAALQSYDEMYIKRLNKSLFDTEKIEESPDRDKVAAIVQELFPVFIRTTNIETNSLNTAASKSKSILRGYRQAISQNFYNLTEQNIYFTLPELRKLVDNRHISLFFCGYNIPIALMLFPEPRKTIYIDDYLRMETKVLKLILTIQPTKKIIEEFSRTPIKSYVLVNISTGKMITSDLLDHTRNYNIPKFKREDSKKKKRQKQERGTANDTPSIIPNTPLTPHEHLKNMQTTAQKKERELRRNYYIWFTQTSDNTGELTGLIQSQERELKNLYHAIYTHPALVKSKPKLFSYLDKASYAELTRELRRYWEENEKSKETATSAFDQATAWIKMEGHRFKMYPFTLHDIVMFFQEVKKGNDYDNRSR